LMKDKRLGIKEEDGGRWFYCALIANLKEGEAREMGKRPAAARLTRAGEVLEVGAKLTCGPGRQRVGEREEGQLGRWTLVGRAAQAGLQACLRASLRRGQRPDWPVGRGNGAGRRGKRKRKEGDREVGRR
jgi:hypothetical protein